MLRARLEPAFGAERAGVGEQRRVQVHEDVADADGGLRTGQRRGAAGQCGGGLTPPGTVCPAIVAPSGGTMRIMGESTPWLRRRASLQTALYRHGAQ